MHHCCVEHCYQHPSLALASTLAARNLETRLFQQTRHHSNFGSHGHMQVRLSISGSVSSCATWVVMNIRLTFRL